MTSPYTGLSVQDWASKTRELIERHPLDPNEIYEVVLQVWNDIFESDIGSKPFRIGIDLFPRPQVIGYFLHELIPLEFTHRYPGIWRREETTDEKDLVYIPNPIYSIEIKTSSSLRNIYGNRSYAQETIIDKKSKSGYYLAINFQKFSKTVEAKRPSVTSMRFGWLDHEDWIGQIAATGQQSRLSQEVERNKLLALPLK
ncbi:MAG: ScaI family restriction endonuclease [Anaerolineales bacterium]|nr:ScaI family restriction endonuclease [Anaerolineales bacterium]